MDSVACIFMIGVGAVLGWLMFIGWVVYEHYTDSRRYHKETMRRIKVIRDNMEADNERF